MNLTKSKIYLFGLIICLCCNNEPISTKVELRSDFSESEFKNAIIGKWKSVYEITGEENVIYLELSEQGKVELILEKNSVRKEFVGNYSVDFLRPPSEGKVTFAELTITTSNGDMIILSRVNFGLHNAMPEGSGFFLRIDESPFGVLKRM